MLSEENTLGDLLALVLGGQRSQRVMWLPKLPRRWPEGEARGQSVSQVGSVAPLCQGKGQKLLKPGGG